MSLILDALHKADHERRKQDDRPGLDSHHDPSAPLPTQEPWRLVLTYTGGILLLAALALGAYFWGKTESGISSQQTPQAQARPTDDSSTSTSTAQSSPTAQPAMPPKVATNNVDSPGTKAATKAAPIKPQNRNAVAALYEQKAAPVTISKPAPQRNVATAIATPKIDPGASAIETQVNRDTPSLPAVNLGNQQIEPLKTNKPVKKSAPSVLADFSQIGSIRSLSWSMQEKIPTLNYSEHNYRAKSRGTIVINGKTLKSGDKISQDLVLENVLEDGALMRYKKQLFKVPALNSWINM